MRQKVKESNHYMSISGKNQVRNQASNVWFDLKIPFYDIILLVSYPDYFLLCNKITH